MAVIRAILLAAAMLIPSVAAAQFPGWSFTLWLDERPALSIEQAVQRITEADQREWLTYLASPALDGRKPNTAGYRQAVEYVEARCQSWGLQTMRQTVPGRDQNLFAWIEGRNPDKVLVVGAHLDHLGGGRLGADDNGSGSTALMGIAHAFSLMPKPAITVVFQWYTSEETGLHGSGYYVANPLFPRHAPDIRKHVGMINLDMVGWLRYRLIVPQHILDTEEALTADFSRHINELVQRYPFLKEVTYNTGNNSDHARFRPYMPVIWFFTGTHSDYHTTRDVVAKINFVGLTQIARAATEVAWRVSQEGTAGIVSEQAITTEPVWRDIYGRPFPIPAGQAVQKGPSR